MIRQICTVVETNYAHQQRPINEIQLNRIEQKSKFQRQIVNSVLALLGTFCTEIHYVPYFYNHVTDKEDGQEQGDAPECSSICRPVDTNAVNIQLTVLGDVLQSDDNEMVEGRDYISTQAV